MQFPDIQLGDAITAAGLQQKNRTLRGYGHVQGGQAIPAGGLDVEIPSDTVMWIGESSVQVDGTANVVTVNPDGSHWRWVSLVVNSDGSVEAVHSSPGEPVEDPETGEKLTERALARPQPPIITSSSRALHSFVYIPPNASEITQDNIVDRRIDARGSFYNHTTFGTSETFETLQVDDISTNTSADVSINDPASVAGDLSVTGDASVSNLVELSASARTTTLDDHDFPVAYRSGNGSDGIHTSHGNLIIQPRTSVGSAIRLLAGSPTPATGLEVNPDQSVAVPNGPLNVGGDIATSGGTTIYDAANGALNADLIDVDSWGESQDITWTGQHAWTGPAPLVGDASDNDWYTHYRDDPGGVRIGYGAAPESAVFEAGSSKTLQLDVDAANGFLSGSTGLEIDTGANVTVPNGTLNLTGGSLVGAGSDLNLGSSNAELQLDSQGTGVDRFVVQDGAGDAVLTVYEGPGDVWIHQGDLRPGGDYNVTSLNKQREVQVDGADGDGIINMKTQ